MGLALTDGWPLPRLFFRMKPDLALKQIVVVFVATVFLYLAVFYGVEHLRSRNGPWEVTFAQDDAGPPAVVVSQPRLQIHNLRILFPGEQCPAGSRPQPVLFDKPRPVPFEVPFGRCLFEDLTFLPGTVTFDLFGHEIELIPRALTIDKQEYSWTSGATISVSATNKPPYLKGK